MTKLEQAARQALEALEEWKSEYNCNDDDEAIAALREALDYPEREWPSGGESEQAEQEPVCIDWDNKTDEPIMGYAAPVRTKDLTDDEIRKLWSDAELDITWFARAVITKYKEKNK